MLRTSAVHGSKFHRLNICDVFCYVMHVTSAAPLSGIVQSHLHILTLFATSFLQILGLNGSLYRFIAPIVTIFNVI